MTMRMDRRFAVVLAVSLVWALLVTALFRRLSGGGDRARAAGPEKALVVATRALPLGTLLTRDAVHVRNVPERLFPAGGFSRIEDVLDRPVVSGIQPEEPVLEARLAARGSGVGLAPLIPTGMRAIAVRVNDVVGVAGFVLPGMRVDVLITGRPSNFPGTVTRTVLQNIVVLSAGQAVQADGKNAISAPVVTLLVTPADAEALTLANNDGHIQLVLRNSTDDAVAATRGRQWNELYAPHAAEQPVKPVEPPKVRTRPVAVPAAVRVTPVVSVAPPVAAAPAPVEQVVVIRGNVKTAEQPAKGGGQ
jgi:pilus assembly protein CpaB